MNFFKKILGNGVPKASSIISKSTIHSANLIIASKEGQKDAVEQLLAEGAEVNAKSKEGLTALCIASLQGHSDVVELLLAKGADVNAKANDGWTALMHASEYGYKGVVELLLAKGADVNVVDKYDNTAMSIAFEKEYRDIVKILKAAGGKDNTSETPLHLAAEKSNTKDEHCFEVIENILNVSTYGDLYITKDQLVFISLAKIVEPKSGLEEVAVNPVKGWSRMAGLVDKKSEILEAMNSAREAASNRRKRLYGLSLESRIEYGEALTRENIETFRLHPGSENTGVIEVVLKSGKSLRLEITGASQIYDRFHLWLIDNPVNVNCNRQGLEWSLPSPRDMLAWFEDPTRFPSIKLDECIRAAKLKSYSVELVEQIFNHPWSKRKQSCQLVKERSVKLASSMGSALAADLFKGEEWRGTCGISFIILAVLIFLGGGPKIISASFGVGALVLLIFIIRNYHRNKQLVIMLSE